jgi:potassium channel subfamily K protein 1
MSCKCSKSTLRSIGLCVFYILYLFLGAAVFSAIESSNEKQIIENVKAKRQEFLELHRQCLNESDLEMFIKRIVDANNKGITAVSNLTVEPNWSYGQAVFFAGTVLTTIGTLFFFFLVRF